MLIGSGGLVRADIRDDVAAVFDRDLSSVDFARAKLEFDRIIDPEIDVERELSKIRRIIAALEKALFDGADSRSKLEAMKHYLYQPGWWNQGRAFSYDLEDPYAKDFRNKLLSDYLEDRKGNCISMPTLMVVLGQRLGLDITLANAPAHLLVKFTDDQGVTHNVEATSGGGITRDAYYREIFPITDQAMEAGIFLRPLSNEEVMAVLGVVVVEYLIHETRYQEAIEVADVLLGHYPDFAYLLAKKGTAAYYILKTEFQDKYPQAQDIPSHLHARFRHLQEINQVSFGRADDLGWVPTDVNLLIRRNLGLAK